MTKRFENCILHIGTEKTGTSTIQSFLDKNRKALLDDDIFYPKTPFSRFGSQWEFVVIAYPEPWTMDAGRACGVKDAESLNVFRKNFKRDLEMQFMRHTNAKTLLLSSEHFHSRLLSVGTITQLRQFLEPWVNNFKIIIYFRRQDKMAVSYYTTQIKSGSNTTKLHLPKDGPRFRYYEHNWIYRIWRIVFGQDALITRLYDSNLGGTKSVLQEFCDICGITLANKKQRVWLNQSVNAEGLGLIYALHKYNKSHEVSLDENQLGIAMSHITQTYTGKYFPITRSDAESFYHRFAEGNELLRKQAFPNAQASLFSADFSQYPDEQCPLPVASLEQVKSYIDEINLLSPKFSIFEFLRRLKQR